MINKLIITQTERMETGEEADIEYLSNSDGEDPAAEEPQQ